MPKCACLGAILLHIVGGNSTPTQPIVVGGRKRPDFPVSFLHLNVFPVRVPDVELNVGVIPFDLTRQVYTFACHSWKTFDMARMPVTIAYSQLIARLLCRLAALPNFSIDSIHGRLNRPRWFL
jgi:hypothetical protein